MLAKRIRAIVFLSLLTATLTALADAPTTQPTPAAEEDGIRVYFSPRGGAAEAVIHAINGATQSLDVAVYSVTHAEIAKAIVDAHKRGVKVRIVLDRMQSSGKYSSATFLKN